MRQGWTRWGFAMVMLAIAALAVAVGCRKGTTLPIKEQPAGVLKLRFTRAVLGPVDLTLDGVRVPITVVGKKKFQELTITGLPAGKHRYFLTSPRDAFGPDQGEVELPEAKGAMLILFSQRFEAVLYGKPEPVPTAEGLPGVKAVLSR